MQRTAPTVAARPTTAANPLRRWLAARSWRWWAACWLILGVSEFAAIFAQLGSRTHVVAPNPVATTPSPAHYYAGWPFPYAHFTTHLTGLTYGQWQIAVQQTPSLANGNVIVFVIDIAWTGIIFSLVVALPVVAWQFAWRSARGEPHGQFWRAAVIALAVVGAWFAVAITVVGNINAGQPTDDATWAQLTPPVTFAALLPGVLSFVVQRGFEGDGGLGIAYIHGPSTYVELIMVLLVAVALPAAIVASVILGGQRTLRRFRRSPTPPSPEVSA